MKNSLALSAFVLVMVLPLVSAADRDWKINRSGQVNFATNRNLVPGDHSPLTTLPAPISVGCAWLGTRTGNGVTSVVGTQTITANPPGVFQRGGFCLRAVLGGVDSLFGSDAEDTVTSNTAAFPVVPEPGAALPMILGVGGLAVMGRKSRK